MRTKLFDEADPVDFWWRGGPDCSEVRVLCQGPRSEAGVLHVKIPQVFFGSVLHVRHKQCISTAFIIDPCRWKELSSLHRSPRTAEEHVWKLPESGSHRLTSTPPANYLCHPADGFSNRISLPRGLFLGYCPPLPTHSIDSRRASHAASGRLSQGKEQGTVAQSRQMLQPPRGNHRRRLAVSRIAAASRPEGRSTFLNRRLHDIFSLS